MDKKIAIVTGATSGIGKATAELFMSKDYFVVITGRRKERLEKLKNQYPNSSDYFCMDIRKKEDVDNFLEYLIDKGFIPDVLINNAGLAAGLDPAYEADWNDWEQMIDTNVKGLLYLTRKLLPEMIKKNSGHIINVGSVAGKEVYPNGAVYCATKSAVEAITRGLRMDLLPFNIKVSSVSPGMVETEFSLVRFKGDVDRAKKVYDGLTPLKPEDIAETIWWMVSRPPHVHIQDVWIMPSAQASPLIVKRN